MIIRGRDLTGPVRETADVVIVGSGCGGGASAKVLAQAGKRVTVLEEGGTYAPSDFDGSEQSAYQNLYRRRAGQTTDDLAITVLQGRCVGGSSTVNWMTSLRTPEFTLKAWRRELGIDGWSTADLEPYFERVERYLQDRPGARLPPQRQQPHPAGGGKGARVPRPDDRQKRTGVRAGGIVRARLPVRRQALR